jgi:hypothetical protein
MNTVRVEEDNDDIIELTLPEQDNEGYEDMYESLCNNAISEEQLQHRHSDKVPTFAMAKIGNKDGIAHEVCIDTGSAISLIDSHYLAHLSTLIT